MPNHDQVSEAAEKFRLDCQRREKSGELSRSIGDAGEFPLYLEVQTHTACNARCTCCPHPIVFKELPNGFMSDDLWEAIIHEASRLPLKRFMPYLNNEPFLDPKMIERLRQIRKRCPDTLIEVSTNASKLTAEISEVLVNEYLVDDLRLSIFGVDQASYSERMPGLDWMSTLTNVKGLLAKNKNAARPLNITIIGIEDENVSDAQWQISDSQWRQLGSSLRLWGYLDRAGNNKQKNEMIFEGSYTQRGCELNRPFERLCILYNGDVIMCSQDWRREDIQANVRESGLIGAWNSPKFRTLRERIMGRGDEVNLCTKCKMALLEVDGSIVPRGCYK